MPYTIFYVSIHAPVWGATLVGAAIVSVCVVSIHAPVWGATKTTTVSIMSRCFNPRTRVGCDAHSNLFIKTDKVSIHAPVWGATSKFIFKPIYKSFNPRTRVGCDVIIIMAVTTTKGFNPRTRVGCDPCAAESVVVDALFQSTHPCGVRRLSWRVLLSCLCFNPRTRVGCDQDSVISDNTDIVSIHAPVWGATNTDDFSNRFYRFQSTHPCGVRPI